MQTDLQTPYRKLSFERLPEAVELLIQQVVELRELIEKTQQPVEKENELMTVGEAAIFMRCSKQNIYLNMKKLPVIRSGRICLFRKNDLIQYMQAS